MEVVASRLLAIGSVEKAQASVFYPSRRLSLSIISVPD
jgi:hypothetical protein